MLSRQTSAVGAEARGPVDFGPPGIRAPGVVRVCLATFGLLVGACAPRVVPIPVEAPVVSAQLDARLLAMTDQRLRDTVLIDEVLRDASAVRRARAALAIGQVQMRQRYPVLRRLLVDADTSIAANAAFALGLAKDSAAVIALERALAGAPDAVAREAAWALGEIGDPARGVLLAALGDGNPRQTLASLASQRSAAVRAELLMALVKLRQIPVFAATPWLADTATIVARAAAYVIGRPRIAAGLSALLPSARHPDEFVRQQVARALTRGSTGDSLASRARSALGRLVGDQSPRVRAIAVISLATFGPDVRADLERALSDADANVRVAAAQGAGSVFASDALAWQRSWEQDTTYMVRRSLLAAARRGGISSLSGAETEWQRSPDWRRRHAVIEARVADPKVDAMAVARMFISDNDGRVRSVALDAIASRAGDDTSARSVLLRGLTDVDLRARATSASALSRAARGTEVSAVLDAYALAARDTDGDARIAAIRYLASAWLRDSARFDASALSRLAAISVPPDTAERAAAERLTPLASWRGASAAARPFAEYERIARRLLAPGARQPVAVIVTERGEITMDLLGADAPMVVDAFMKLAEQGYYRETRFHRVVPGFVAQDGDPRGDGSGGPGFAVRDALSRQRHERGSLGLATSGPDTGGSQYYLCLSAQPHLDGHYTVFGHLRTGLTELDRVVQGDRVLRIEIR